MAGPSYELSVVTVSGDEQAMKRILKHYEPMINEQCGGNKMVRRQIIKALREAILYYDLNDPAKMMHTFGKTILMIQCN